jgi:uncharacterized protein YjbJ (UPF0337 family)
LTTPDPPVTADARRYDEWRHRLGPPILNQKAHHRLAGVGQGEAMSLVDKAKNKVEEREGKSKEATGRATGDNKLKAEGKADQAKAKLKQTGEKIKDAFK